MYQQRRVRINIQFKILFLFRFIYYFQTIKNIRFKINYFYENTKKFYFISNRPTSNVSVLKNNISLFQLKDTKENLSDGTSLLYIFTFRYTFVLNLFERITESHAYTKHKVKVMSIVPVLIGRTIQSSQINKQIQFESDLGGRRRVIVNESATRTRAFLLMFSFITT